LLVLRRRKRSQSTRTTVLTVTSSGRRDSNQRDLCLVWGHRTPSRRRHAADRRTSYPAPGANGSKDRRAYRLRQPNDSARDEALPSGTPQVQSVLSPDHASGRIAEKLTDNTSKIGG